MPLWTRRPPDRLVSTLTGHGEPVVAAAIAPDGSWLATASLDKTARIWSAEGTAVATLTGHGEAVVAVAIAPDGSWLAIASQDTTARIWGIDGTLRAPALGNEVRERHFSLPSWAPVREQV